MIPDHGIDNFADWPATLDPDTLRSYVVAVVNGYDDEARHRAAEWLRDGESRPTPCRPWCTSPPPPPPGRGTGTDGPVGHSEDPTQGSSTCPYPPFNPGSW